MSQAKVCPRLFHLQSFDIDIIRKVFLQISKDSNRLVSDGKGGMKSDLKNTHDEPMHTKFKMRKTTLWFQNSEGVLSGKGHQ